MSCKALSTYATVIYRYARPMLSASSLFSCTLFTGDLIGQYIISRSSNMYSIGELFWFVVTSKDLCVLDYLVFVFQVLYLLLLVKFYFVYILVMVVLLFWRGSFCLLVSLLLQLLVVLLHLFIFKLVMLMQLWYYASFLSF